MICRKTITYFTPIWCQKAWYLHVYKSDQLSYLKHLIGAKNFPKKFIHPYNNTQSECCYVWVRKHYKMRVCNSYQETLPGGDLIYSRDIGQNTRVKSKHTFFPHMHVMNFSISIFGLPNSTVRQRIPGMIRIHSKI